MVFSSEMRAKLPFGKKSVVHDFAVEKVTVGPFRISVTERGQTDSLLNANLVNRVEGTTTIISILSEGTLVKGPVKSTVPGVVSEIAEDGALTVVTVETNPFALRLPFALLVIPSTAIKHSVDMSEYTQVVVEVGKDVREDEILAGDVVCELDASALVDKEQQQRILVTQAAADLEKGAKNVEIQIAQNESDNAAARLKQHLSKLDLQKYLHGDYVQERQTILGEITTFEEGLTRSQENYDFSKRIARKGYKSLIDLEADRIAVLTAGIKLDVEKGKLNVLDKYTYERTIKELEETAAESIRESVRVRLAGLAALAQFEAELQARKLTYGVEVAKLALLQRQIRDCRLVATQQGEVVYANQQSRRSEPVVIEEGATVRERQTLIKLPDLTKMKVSARIHESKISQIKAGQDVLIRVDAFPNEVFHGKLDSVSSVPVPGSWPNMDLKEYEAEIRITDADYAESQMKPGLTASIEIIVEEQAENVLQAPVQAVIFVGSKYFAFVRKPDGNAERRELIIGATNDQKMEIKDGLEEGEEVIMNARTRLAKELEELSKELGADAANAAAKSGDHRLAKSAPKAPAASSKSKSKPKSKSKSKPTQKLDQKQN